LEIKSLKKERARLRETIEDVQGQLAGGVINDTIADIMYDLLNEALNHKEDKC
jgi:hypothetical protein